MILALPENKYLGLIKETVGGAMADKRMDFGHWVDRVFWGLMVAVALYASTQLRSLSESVSNLNEKMAVVVVKLNYSEERQNTTDRRVDKLEDQLRNHR